jgi:hypothetical protein
VPEWRITGEADLDRLRPRCFFCGSGFEILPDGVISEDQQSDELPESILTVDRVVCVGFWLVSQLYRFIYPFFQRRFTNTFVLVSVDS